jgi:thiamine biosynthesis lipoprotein
MKKIEFEAMGSSMTVFLEAAALESIEALMAVPQWFEEWEQCLSRFRVDSELSQLNRSNGQPFTASQTMWEVLGLALNAAQESDGLFTPTLLEALEYAGYNRDFEILATDSAAVTRYQSLSNVYNAPVIELDPDARTVTLPPGVKLDFGGIAKGWSAQRALKRLEKYGATMVDAGGDIAVSGLMSDGRRWPVGILNPYDQVSDLETVYLGQQGVATSGRDYHRWENYGVWQHHIIDPRTGKPAMTDVYTATVIAPTVIEAEVLAKVVLILGSKAGMDWLNQHPSVEGLLTLEDGRILKSKGFEQFVA